MNEFLMGVITGAVPAILIGTYVYWSAKRLWRSFHKRLIIYLSDSLTEDDVCQDARISALIEILKIGGDV